MQRATIEDAQDRLPALIARAQAGEEVMITEGGRDVARLEAVAAPPPQPAGKESDDDRLERLERAGIIRRGRGGPPNPRILAPFPADARSSGVLDALLADRDEDYR